MIARVWVLRLCLGWLGSGSEQGSEEVDDFKSNLT